MQKKFSRTLFVSGLFVLTMTIPQTSHSMDDDEVTTKMVRKISTCTDCGGNFRIINRGITNGELCRGCLESFTEEDRVRLGFALHEAEKNIRRNIKNEEWKPTELEGWLMREMTRERAKKNCSIL